MGIFTYMEKYDYERLVFCQDEASGLKAIIAIHDTTLGPALGDSRMWTYATFRALGRFIQGLNGRYITAEDVGTTVINAGGVINVADELYGYNRGRATYLAANHLAEQRIARVTKSRSQFLQMKKRF